ncbi:Ubiquitin-protein ligase E3A [Sparganum proliferum]
MKPVPSTSAWTFVLSIISEEAKLILPHRTDPKRVIQDRIRRYFTQLTHGCGDSRCGNVNCASSTAFRHKGITNTQAAAIALQLMQNGDHLCVASSSNYPDSESLTRQSPDAAEDAGSSGGARGECLQAPSPPSESSTPPRPPRLDASRVRISESALNPLRLVNPPESLQPSSSQSDPLTTTQDESTSSNLPMSLSRFLLQLANYPRSSDEESIPPNDFADFPNLASFNFALTTEGARTPTADSTVTAAAAGAAESASDDKKNLRDFLERLKRVDPSTSSAERTGIGRAQGLTLGELSTCIATCRETGSWLALHSLIEGVFTSIPALAASFPLAHCDSARASNSTNTQRSEPSPQDIDMSESEPRIVASSAVSSLPTEDTDSSKADGDIDMRTVAPEPEGCPAPPVGDKSARLLKVGPKAVPVNIFEVQKAYKLLLDLPPEADIIALLSKTISRFVLTKLRLTFNSNPPASLLLENPEPLSQEADMQQRAVNVFVILFACPLVTDPLYFENILPILCRATTWLPMPIQARICKTWFTHFKEASGVLSKSSASPTDSSAATDFGGADTSLVDLQKILMQQITLRCLTLDPDSTPNDDKQIREAAKVLRIVFFSSLLVGGLDSEEQREREARENSELETLLPSQGTRHPRRQIRQDPLAASLGIHPNDCRNPLIPASEFINETLNDVIDPEKDFLCYRSRSDKLSFMELPFLLQTTTKSVQLFYDNRLRMLEERRSAFLHSLLASDPELPFFKLRVARDRVVEDALVVLELAWLESPADLKKQLFVEFDGEQGIDEGGLSKEFFQLIIQRIFNPDYGMFIFDDETQTFWFNPSPMEDLDREYCLIGTILGLAIYNHIILDIHFPSVLYRKLVGKLGNFEDLKEGWPTLAHGLLEMLKYEEDDFEEVFCSNFVISRKDMFGNMVTEELLPGGLSKPVTKANRQEFVDLTADYMLNTSIKRQFSAFRKGFNMVIDESPLTFLFTPKEIELLVRGSQDYDFSELERVTEYEGDYTAETPIIKSFWEVVHNLPEEKQRQLLQFTTGSDRIPLGGMSKLKFIIARQGPDSDRLPTAHTCFNILLLPEYSSKEKLERCLMSDQKTGSGRVTAESLVAGMPANNIDVVRLVTARAAELAACEASLGIITARAITQLQRLPVRLRRRAASHHPRRLPRRLHRTQVVQELVKQAKRVVAAAAGDGGKTVAKGLIKRPSRRYRRRCQRLEALAVRRCRLPAAFTSSFKPSEGPGEKANWIPTHLWHAKRFHFIENWGWRIPYAPTDKVFKACQRAAVSRCLLFDHGYLNCFQLAGTVHLLKRCLSAVTLPFHVSAVSTDLPRAPACPGGFLETVNLFCLGPASAEEHGASSSHRLPNITRPILGPVRILWGPGQKSENAQSRVWIWLHPCMAADAWRVLTSLDFVVSSPPPQQQQDAGASSHPPVSVTLSDCTGHLCRVSLLGPFSHQILADILCPPGLLTSPPSQSSEGLGDWALWNRLKEYAQSTLFPAGSAVGLICGNFLKNRPRLKLHNRNWLVGLHTRDAQSGAYKSVPLSVSQFSDLQSQSTAFYCRLAQLFDGQSVCQLPGDEIPILLVQNATPSLISSKPLCVGWDVILPRQILRRPGHTLSAGTTGTTQTTSSIQGETEEWETPPVTSSARDLIVACVYRGTRVGGVRDQLRWASLSTDAGGRFDAFPYLLWPDTPAGRLVADGAHLKRASSASNTKRRSRTRFRAVVPTATDWRKLIAMSVSCGDDPACAADDNNFFVLRDKAMLVLVVKRLLADDPRARLTVDHLSRYHPQLPRALFLVKLEVLGRGIPEPRSVLYAPRSKKDVEEARAGSLTLTKTESPDKDFRVLGYVDEGAYSFTHGLATGLGFISLAAIAAVNSASTTSPASLREPFPERFKVVLFKSPRSSLLQCAKLSLVI